VRHDRGQPPLSLEEAFRTLGHQLDGQGASRVEFSVDATGVTLSTTPANGGRRYLWSEIVRQARVQRQARRATTETATWLDGHAFTRWALVLRVTGRLLDAGAAPRCQATITIGAIAPPRACEVRVCNDSGALFGTEEIRRELLALRAREGNDRQRAMTAPRPWWAAWRWPGKPPEV
jgi:hypothetical protein